MRHGQKNFKILKSF